MYKHILREYLLYVNSHRQYVISFLDTAINLESKLKDVDIDVYKLIEEKKTHDLDKIKPFYIEAFATRHGLVKGLIPKDRINPIQYIHIKQALLDHVRNNDHHLEYYCPYNIEEYFTFDEKQVDIVPVKPVDIERVPDTSICKTVCDWCAVSKYLNSNPIKYYKSILGKRFVFHSPDTNEKFLYLLEVIWGGLQ